MKESSTTSAVATPALVAAAATTVVYLPQLTVNANQLAELPGALRASWFVLLLVAAPVAAYIVTRRARLAARRTPGAALILAGVPQVLLLLALTYLDVWLEVRSGYLLADSGEEAMAYGLSAIFGTLLGLVLAALVTLGASLGRRSRPTARPTARPREAAADA
jgi:hypothetical protein